MMLRFAMVATALASLASGAAAQAAFDNKYDVTAEEQAACQADATLYCGSVYPDSDHLLTCMKANRNRLSPRCLRTFTAGLARRHL